MARFRKVNPRIWSDAKFRQLSERAKLLWFYLLTGPDVTSLPGLIVAGRMHLAEALSEGLPKGFLEGFDEAFAEVSKKGMAKADFDSRVIWLPNAWKYNKPENPNVVRSWRDHWDNVPECPLKVVAYTALKEYVEGLGKGYGEAFRESLSNPMPNQEPEQEPEPEQEQELLRAEPAKAVVEKKPRERDPLFDAIAEVSHFDPSVKSQGSLIGKATAVLRKAKPPYTPEEIRRIPEAIERAGLSIVLTPSAIEKYAGWVRDPAKPTNGKKTEPRYAATDNRTPEQKAADLAADRKRVEADKAQAASAAELLAKLRGIGTIPEENP